MAGRGDAARTDDILAIIRAQFLLLEPGPKLIAADLNGSIDAFPTLTGMLEGQGWHDVGMAGDKSGGNQANRLATPMKIRAKPGSTTS